MDVRRGPIVCTRSLPDSYTSIWGLDLARNRTTAIVLNVLGIPIFVFAGWLFLRAAAYLRPEIVSGEFVRRLAGQPLILYLDFFVVVALTTLLHEFIHGVFFWIYTRSTPVFGIKLLFAYAGAPEWYIPRNRYAVVGLAPLVLISVVGFLLIPLTSLPAAQLILFGMVVNTAGAVGDIYVCGRILHLAPDVLIQDTGYVFDVYGSAG